LKLVGTNEDTIYRVAKELLVDQHEYQRMAQASNPYGDGHASARIVKALLDYLSHNNTSDR